MDEQPRRYRHLLALLWFPLALLLVIPAVLLLGLSLYVRAVAIALANLIRYVFGVKTPPAGTQSPHPPFLFEIGVLSKKPSE
jgi:hypothetical protein